MTYGPPNSSFKPFALLSITVMLVWGIAAIDGASKLTPPTSQEKWFPNEHMFDGVIDTLTSGFTSGTDANYVPMSFTWGIDGIDRDVNENGEKFNKYKPNVNRGSSIFNNFDFTDKDVRNHIKESCQLMREQLCPADGCNFDTLIIPDKVVCFIDELEDWHSATYGNSIDDVSDDELLVRVKKFRKETKPASSPIVGSWEKYIGFVDDKLEYVMVTATMSMYTLQSIDTKRFVLTSLEELLEKIDKLPEAQKAGKVLTESGIAWTWMDTEQGLVDGLFNGFLICFPVAFLVLLLATKNLIVSFHSILSIGMIVASVLGVVQMMGFPLGVAESIAGIIVVGFSVDYVVHMAHMFIDGSEHDCNTAEERFAYRCGLEFGMQ